MYNENGNVYPIHKTCKEVKIEIPVLTKRKCYDWKRRLSSYRLTVLAFFVLFEGTISFFTDFILKKHLALIMNCFCCMVDQQKT